MKIRKRKPLEAGVVLECATEADAQNLKTVLGWLPKVRIEVREGRVVTFVMDASRVCSFALILSQTLQRLGMR